MDGEGFRILIASTEKTGNTWLKLLLSRIYDLPAPYIGHDFTASEAEALGARWVTHQHFFPERPLLDWAEARGAHLVTTIRHPADTLVSLYHYCCNYADHYKDDPRIARAIAADAPVREATAGMPHHVVDGELIRALQDRIICDVNISISWMLSGRSIVVRYEDLRTDPLTTLTRVTDAIASAPQERIERAIAECDIAVLRDTNKIDSRFFRRALIGESRTVLPPHVLRRFAEEEPFKSQFAFLSYTMDADAFIPPREEAPPPSISSSSSDAGDRFDNGVPFVPILTELLESLPSERRQQWRDVFDTSRDKSFFNWVNSPAGEDQAGRAAVPLITNLAAFVYKQRADLQAAFPDIFDENRLGYAGWFLRYAGYRYDLDQSFLTPIALSWISVPRTETRPRPSAVGASTIEGQHVN